MKQTANEERLQEVKAILHRLQQIRPDAASEAEPMAPSAPPEKGPPASSPLPGVRGFLRSKLAMAGGGGILAAVIGAATLWTSAEQPPKVSTLAPGKPMPSPQDKDRSAALSQPAQTAHNQAPANSKDVLEDHLGHDPASQKQASTAANAGNAVSMALQLMAEGHILEARARLRRAAEAGSAEAALTLARTYDPNYLKSAPSPDAAPDVAEAEHWYRRWHELATRQGLVMDNARLERIINSMR